MQGSNVNNILLHFISYMYESKWMNELLIYLQFFLFFINTNPTKEKNQYMRRFCTLKSLRSHRNFNLPLAREALACSRRHNSL